MKQSFKVGDRVHINTDNLQWGRVTSDATIIQILTTKSVECSLIEVDSIRASIVVLNLEMTKVE